MLHCAGRQTCRFSETHVVWLPFRRRGLKPSRRAWPVVTAVLISLPSFDSVAVKVTSFELCAALPAAIASRSAREIASQEILRFLVVISILLREAGWNCGRPQIATPVPGGRWRG